MALEEHISKLHARRFVRHSFIMVTTVKTNQESKHVIEKTILSPLHTQTAHLGEKPSVETGTFFER